MSEAASDGAGRRGPMRDSVTPPIDATATVTIDEDPVTVAHVPAGSRLAVHSTARTDSGTWTEFDEADIPDPDDRADGRIGVEFDVPVRSWITVTVADERVCRVGAKADSTVRVLLEPADETTRTGP